MADINIAKNTLQNYQATLQQTSYDTKNDEYLCVSQMLVYDFDKYKEDIDNNKKSFDVLYMENNDIFCIEFKNEKYSDVDSKKIKGKYRDGLNLLENLLNECKIQIKNYQFFFFVVFKDPNTMSYYKFHNQGQEILFGLNDLCKTLSKSPKPNPIHRYVKIKTKPKQYFIEKYGDKLQC